MKQMQLKDLYAACKEAMNRGDGEKYLVLSDDNEGNGYHGMFYTITQASKERDAYEGLIYDSVEKNLDNILVIG